MQRMKNMPALVESIKALSVVFFFILIFLALSKFNVITGYTANLWIEGTILSFGALILFLETFKEGFRQFSVSLMLAVLTISATALLAYSKITGYVLVFLTGITEGFIYIAIAGLLMYELIFETTRRRR